MILGTEECMAHFLLGYSVVVFLQSFAMAVQLLTFGILE